MVFLLASSKSFDINQNIACKDNSTPCFAEKSLFLISQLQKLNLNNLKKILGVSPALANLNYERYLGWSTTFTLENSNQAILSFSGDVFKGLNVSDFSSNDFTYAQENVRIISGLFGLLCPLDLIQPYRLELGTKFSFANYKNLYDFWKIPINEKLKELLEGNSSKVIIHLASQEYFKVIDNKKLDARIVNVEFKENYSKGYKIVAIHAKRARGLMTRYAIKNNIKLVEDLKDFNLEGYSFNKEQSKESSWVFTR